MEGRTHQANAPNPHVGKCSETSENFDPCTGEVVVTNRLPSHSSGSGYTSLFRRISMAETHATTPVRISQPPLAKW
jgi:hypothetical protein